MVQHYGLALDCSHHDWNEAVYNSLVGCQIIYVRFSFIFDVICVQFLINCPLASKFVIWYMFRPQWMSSNYVCACGT